MFSPRMSCSTLGFRSFSSEEKTRKRNWVWVPEPQPQTDPAHPQQTPESCFSCLHPKWPFPLGMVLSKLKMVTSSCSQTHFGDFSCLTVNSHQEFLPVPESALGSDPDPSQGILLRFMAFCPRGIPVSPVQEQSGRSITAFMSLDVTGRNSNGRGCSLCLEGISLGKQSV